MKLKLFLAFSFLLFVLLAQATHLPQTFNRGAFYNAIRSEDLDEINNELTVLESATINEKEAFEGALLMKKSGLLSKAAEKLKFFKSGRIKLETALLKDSSNTEYHFLRLIIQEHAPKIVKYRKELEADSEMIKRNYKSLPAVVQQVIKDYSTHSKILHTQDF